MCVYEPYFGKLDISYNPKTISWAISPQHVSFCSDKQ